MILEQGEAPKDNACLPSDWAGKDSAFNHPGTIKNRNPRDELGTITRNCAELSRRDNDMPPSARFVRLALFAG
jgi:hypothetical protein